jgi:hypothetical protein
MNALCRTLSLVDLHFIPIRIYFLGRHHYQAVIDFFFITKICVKNSHFMIGFYLDTIHDWSYLPGRIIIVNEHNWGRNVDLVMLRQILVGFCENCTPSKTVVSTKKFESTALACPRLSCSAVLLISRPADNLCICEVSSGEFFALRETVGSSTGQNR